MARLQPQLWPALEQIFAMLAASEPPLATMAAERVPAPGPRLANTTLFFWRALGLGSAEAWLGGAARQAAQGGDAARQWAALQRDIALLSEQHHASTPVPGEWRPHPLPLQLGDTLQLATWFARALPVDDDGADPGKHPRDKPASGGRDFVLDVAFAHFGRLRFRGQAWPKRLDLAIASARPLPDSLRDGARAVFQSALDAAGITGTLAFTLGLGAADLPVAPYSAWR
ncbi:MAG: hypothetical protein D6782_07880 [Alphaproteobacteria bacterium]|nr:MAG: hypothetical protein D6782_07880 [Alphaproteobacteria bacterium]